MEKCAQQMIQELKQNFWMDFLGVYTKRWHDGTDKERNLAIIEKLKGVPKEKRKVKFITAMAISNGEKTESVEAVINGYIAENPKGNNGFGFDEIFELENGKTLAELSQEEKNEISARRKALENIKKITQDITKVLNKLKLLFDIRLFVWYYIIKLNEE